MNEDYTKDKECIQALVSMYEKYGIDRNNADVLDMIDVLKKELNVECSGHVMTVGKDYMSEDDFNMLMLGALEEDYLDEIGKRNIFLA